MKGGTGGGDTGRIHAGEVLDLEWKRHLCGAEPHEVMSLHKPDKSWGPEGFRCEGGKEAAIDEDAWQVCCCLGRSRACKALWAGVSLWKRAFSM